MIRVFGVCNTVMFLRHHLIVGGPVAEWVRSLNFSVLNHSIISRLCPV